MDDSIRKGDQRIPAGQYKTNKWPVLTFGPTPEIDLDTLNLRSSFIQVGINKSMGFFSCRIWFQHQFTLCLSICHSTLNVAGCISFC